MNNGNSHPGQRMPSQSQPTHNRDPVVCIWPGLQSRMFTNRDRNAHDLAGINPGLNDGDVEPYRTEILDLDMNSPQAGDSSQATNGFHSDSRSGRVDDNSNRGNSYPDHPGAAGEVLAIRGTEQQGSRIDPTVFRAPAYDSTLNPFPTRQGGQHVAIESHEELLSSPNRNTSQYNPGYTPPEWAQEGGTRLRHSTPTSTTYGTTEGTPESGAAIDDNPMGVQDSDASAARE